MTRPKGHLKRIDFFYETSVHHLACYVTSLTIFDHGNRSQQTNLNDSIEIFFQNMEFVASICAASDES